MKGLYLVTDHSVCGERSLAHVVVEAVKGGVSYVQLRGKNLSTKVFLEEAQKVKTVLKPFGVPLIINNQINIALAVKADGVHIGQDDMPYEVVRKLMGQHVIIGLSVEQWEDVVKAQDADVNYLGVSPVFETATKTDTKAAWGLEGLARIKAYSRLPLVAIGGINAHNAAQTVKAGADCIAVVSAICAVPDSMQAAKQLHDIIVKSS